MKKNKTLMKTYLAIFFLLFVFQARLYAGQNEIYVFGNIEVIDSLHINKNFEYLSNTLDPSNDLSTHLSENLSKIQSNKQNIAEISFGNGNRFIPITITTKANTKRIFPGYLENKLIALRFNSNFEISRLQINGMVYSGKYHFYGNSFVYFTQYDCQGMPYAKSLIESEPLDNKIKFLIGPNKGRIFDIGFKLFYYESFSPVNSVIIKSSSKKYYDSNTNQWKDSCYNSPSQSAINYLIPIYPNKPEVTGIDDSEYPFKSFSFDKNL